MNNVGIKLYCDLTGSGADLSGEKCVLSIGRELDISSKPKVQEFETFVREMCRAEGAPNYNYINMIKTDKETIIVRRSNDAVFSGMGQSRAFIYFKDNKTLVREINSTPVQKVLFGKAIFAVAAKNYVAVGHEGGVELLESYVEKFDDEIEGKSDEPFFHKALGHRSLYHTNINSEAKRCLLAEARQRTADCHVLIGSKEASGHDTLSSIEFGAIDLKGKYSSKKAEQKREKVTHIEEKGNGKKEVKIEKLISNEELLSLLERISVALANTSSAYNSLIGSRSIKSKILFQTEDSDRLKELESAIKMLSSAQKRIIDKLC